MEKKVKKGSLIRLGQILQTKKYAILAELLLVFGVVLLIIESLRPIAGENLLLTQAIIWVANVILIVLVWQTQKLRGEHFRDLGLRALPNSPKKIFSTLLWSLVVFITALIAFVSGASIAAMLGVSTPAADVGGYDYLKDNPLLFVLSLCGVYLVSSFGEEYVYRGYLIDRAMSLVRKRWQKNTLAIVFSALFFGLAHYGWGLAGIIQTTFMGAVLAGFYLVLKRRLIILILAHAYMDTLLFASIYFG